MRFLSPTRLVAAISNVLLKWVCQRTILIFAVVDMLLSCAIIWWMFCHKQVAFLGYFIYNWKTYIIFLGLRICIMGAGIYVVWQRAIHLVKIFYGFFFLAWFLALWTVIPVHMLDCRCVDFLQCAAVASFAKKGTMLNPYWEPDVKYFASKRSVPFGKPPSDPREATAFSEDLLANAAKFKDFSQPETPASLLEHEAKVIHVAKDGETVDGDVTVAVESMAYGHGRLVNKRRRSHTLAPDKTPLRWHKSSFVQTQKQETTLSMHGMGPHPRRSSKQEVRTHPLIFFNITHDNIRWVGSHAPACTKYPLDNSTAVETKNRLQQTKADKATEVDDSLSSTLFICAMDPVCGAVSAEVFEDVMPIQYKICQHSLQLVPMYAQDPRARAIDQEVGPNGLYFQRNPITIKRYLEANMGTPSKFYKYAFRTLDPAHAVPMLSDIEKGSCICDNFDKAGGCRTYVDDLGKNRFWCYVKQGRRKTCIEQGHSLFWDAKAEKIWSESICTSAACRCSELGQYPYNPEDPRLNHSVLSDNLLNYGADCKKWNTDDTHPWCYVGWDSVCPDRSRPKPRWATKKEEPWARYSMRNQYKSQLPVLCRQKEQESIRDQAANACEDYSRVVEFVMLLNLFSFLPMMVIIFKFLSNRCGDEFEFEEQFAVVLSTDEDESEDEWASGETHETKGAAKGEEKKSQGDGARASEG